MVQWRTSKRWKIGEERKGGEALCKTGSCMARNYLTYPPTYLPTPLQSAAREGGHCCWYRKAWWMREARGEIEARLEGQEGAVPLRMIE